METAKLKSFAATARIQLIREVTARINVVLSAASAARVESNETVVALERAIVDAGGGGAGRSSVAERVAYTWFNRIVALRFMDVNGYTGIGVVSPEHARATGQPEILADAKRGQFDPDIIDIRTATRVTQLLNGTRRSNDAQGEAYGLLLAAYCRSWNKAMPFMFQEKSDYTELLIPADLLAESSVLYKACQVITTADCSDVEVIGWLYQFYISERKAEVFAGFKKNKKAGVAEIPAATQLFTPHWIVRYLVENSLGRLWLLNRPNSNLAGMMDYYIAPIDEDDGFLKISGPDELKIIDPACGSGHMLTYAFDLLYAIYEEEGYSPPDIPSLILAKNLYGTEIDERAGSLAAFALTMKARHRQRTFFSKPTTPNICVLQPISFTPDELCELATPNGNHVEETAFWNQFKQADSQGSLIQPRKDLLPVLKEYTDMHVTESVWGTRAKAERVIHQAEYLQKRYHVVVANPPYMGSGNMGIELQTFARREYPESKSDLYSMFIERGLTLLLDNGYSSMVTMESWMFLSTYRQLREKLLASSTIESLVHMPYSGRGRTSMGINFGTVASSLRVGRPRPLLGEFVCISFADLDDRGVPITFPVQNGCRSSLDARELAKIPGQPIVYWASPHELNLLTTGLHVGDRITTREGLTTGDNGTFLRRWYEVGLDRIGFGQNSNEQAQNSGKRWFPYVKGGEFRRWFGNLEYVVDWESNGFRQRLNVDRSTGRVRSHNYNGAYAFREGLTWSGLSTEGFSVRYVPPGYMFDTKGPMGFASSRESLLAVIALLNSSSANRYMEMLAPTMDFKLGHVLAIPYPLDSEATRSCSQLAERIIELSRVDWDSVEISMGFEGLELSKWRTVADWHASRSQEAQIRLHEMERLELDLDRNIAIAFDRDPQSTPTSPALEWKLGRAESHAGVMTARSCRSLISFAVGCMFGRYSLDSLGIVLATQGQTLQDYLDRISGPRFMADADNVIPITDGEWFADDVVGRFRQFLRVTFGDERFEENVRFVEAALGKPIGKYFVRDFYADHVRLYKNRPIYWLFSSPKGSFNALIYMHRYTPSTASTVLNEYLREFQAKLRAELQSQERIAAGNSAPRAKILATKAVERIRSVLVELEEYEHDVLYPLATQKISIDLDDGVRANYPKLGAALKKIPGLDAIDE